METTDAPSALAVWFHPSKWSREINVMHSELERLELIVREKEELYRCMEKRLEEKESESARQIEEHTDVLKMLETSESKLKNTEESLEYMASQNLELHKRVRDNEQEIASLRQRLEEADNFDERLNELNKALEEVEQMKEKYEARIKTLRDQLAESRRTVEMLLHGKDKMPGKISMTSGEGNSGSRPGGGTGGEKASENAGSLTDNKKRPGADDFRHKYPRKERETDGWLNPLPDF